MTNRNAPETGVAAARTPAVSRENPSPPFRSRLPEREPAGTITVLSEGPDPRCQVTETFYKHRLARRNLFSTLVAAAALTLPICAAIYAATLGGAELLRNVQWAWIPPRFWHAYQVCCLLAYALLIARLGALSVPFLKGREALLIANFVGQSAILCGCTLLRLRYGPIHFLGFGPPNATNRILIFWALASVAFALGCWRARRKRLAAQ